MGDQKWSRLIERGHRMLEERKFAESEQAFRAVLELKEDVVARNNLALVVFQAGEPSRALELLGPNLDALPSPAGNPFSFALAAQILAALGRETEARKNLKNAIRVFELGRALLEKGDLTERSWNEYTITIMMGAGALNDHHLVHDLYRRWERYHVSLKNRYLAGVAAFNLGRYSRAASLWGFRDVPFGAELQRVAHLVEGELVPPFSLGYHLFEAPKPEEKSDATYFQDGINRAIALAYLFGEEIEKRTAEQLLSALIKNVDEWGVAFGKRLLEASAAPYEFKLQAALSLVDCGVFAEDEPITIIVDGTEKEIRVRHSMLNLEPDPELDKLDQQAQALQAQGHLEDAVELLEPLFKWGRLHPPTMITLSNLYQEQERYEEACMLLEILEEVFPENPAILSGLAGIWVKRKDFERASDYLEQLEKLELDEEYIFKVRKLRALLVLLRSGGAEHIKKMLLAHEEKKREQIEKKLLPLESTVLRGLKNMPNDWLENICQIYHLEPVRLRRDREKMIAAALNREEVLYQAVQDLGDEGYDLLAFLLERGGWVRLNVVSRIFGTMQGDGYRWQENDPQSPLGRLWSSGLVMVGRARLESGYARIAAVPSDLREKLASFLEVARRSEN
ncbi:MAG: tetratricopeptide repeat protein [Firmicutes bacterium]|nr:tetratricopeptide repeat protein [Bacillota bacterium]